MLQHSSGTIVGTSVPAPQTPTAPPTPRRLHVSSRYFVIFEREENRRRGKRMRRGRMKRRRERKRATSVCPFFFYSCKTSYFKQWNIICAALKTSHYIYFSLATSIQDSRDLSHDGERDQPADREFKNVFILKISKNGFLTHCTKQFF